MRVAYSATPCGVIKTIGAWARAQSFALLLTAASLLLVSLSATIMWWRRRPSGMLGAPLPAGRPRFSALLVASIAALALLLPLFGISLLIVMAADWMLLPRFPAARHWLGLTPRVA